MKTTTTTTGMFGQLKSIRRHLRAMGIRPAARQLGTYPMQVARFLAPTFDPPYSQVLSAAKLTGHLVIIRRPPSRSRQA